MTRYCKVCGTSYGIESHHIVKRSQNANLVNCKLNLIDLCYIHHRDHKKGVHFNKELDRKLKLELQNKLENLFDKDYLTKEEINKILQISEKALNRLIKTLQLHNDKYVKEDVIKVCMGGKYVV
ncbi:hypothetical protein [uncultured Clostridium sp.]|uniref:hypothetical protein n=1 Tax=uncultured Clostridium sp. TaxID=59620 RepID=UPI00280BEF81|nr:hypothetical protein [uncultured Clostridium sp.]